jgi:hypothetical protein
VLRIHDILVWIRNRIRGSMPLTNRSGSGQSFSEYYFLKVLLHHFAKVKSQKEVTKSRNQGFPHYFCLMIEGSRPGSGSIPLTNEPDPDPGGPKTRGSGGTGSGSATLHINETTFTYQNCGDCYTIATLAQNDK